MLQVELTYCEVNAPSFLAKPKS